MQKMYFLPLIPERLLGKESVAIYKNVSPLFISSDEFIALCLRMELACVRMDESTAEKYKNNGEMASSNSSDDVTMVGEKEARNNTNRC